jgi:hypothetical protein
MAEDTIEVTEATVASLEAKFKEFVGELDEAEGALLAAMVTGQDQAGNNAADDVSGFAWISGWGGWFGGNSSFVSTNGGTWISNNTGNFRGW